MLCDGCGVLHSHKNHFFLSYFLFRVVLSFTVKKKSMVKTKSDQKKITLSPPTHVSPGFDSGELMPFIYSIDYLPVFLCITFILYLKIFIYLDDLSAAITSLNESSKMKTDISKIKAASTRRVQFVHPQLSGIY